MFLFSKNIHKNEESKLIHALQLLSAPLLIW